MRGRRILSLWFPRLGAERLLRRMRGMPPALFAVVGEEANNKLKRLKIHLHRSLVNYSLLPSFLPYFS